MEENFRLVVTLRLAQSAQDPSLNLEARGGHSSTVSSPKTGPSFAKTTAISKQQFEIAVVLTTENCSGESSMRAGEAANFAVSTEIQG
jgi:hypothetical protein